MNGPLHLITIGYAKRALDPSSREHARMRDCARVLGEYHVIVFTRRTDGYREPVRVENLVIHPTNARTKVGMLIAAYRIGRNIMKQRRGVRFVVSSQDPFETSLVGRWLTFLRPARHHVQMHGDLLNPRAQGSGLLWRVRVAYMKYVLRHTSCIRVVSQRIKRSVVALGVEAQRVKVLPIQASMEHFLQIGSTRHVRTDSPVRLLFVGRFAAEKNIPLILRAVAGAREAGASVVLTCVGDGPQRMQLEQLQNELGLQIVVTLLPWTNDIATLMAGADALLLASDHEGWAMVLVEAMAAGLPVITTDVGCAGELVEDGVHGLVVPVGDLNRYTNAVYSLAVDAVLREQYGRAAHERIGNWAQTPEVYLSQWEASFRCL